MTLADISRLIVSLFLVMMPFVASSVLLFLIIRSGIANNIFDPNNDILCYL